MDEQQLSQPDRARPAGIDALLLDMDGVVRHWNPAREAAVERAFGLPDGILIRVSRQVPEDELGVRGACTFSAWLDAIARELTPLIGPTEAEHAVAEWAAYRGDVDPEMLAVVARLRSRLPVHVLSNAHDCFLDDMQQLGLVGAFDGFHSSAELGVAKPDPAFYLAATERIGIPPERCLFIDDRAENVEGARSVGMTASTFTTPAAVDQLISASAEPRR